MNVWGCFRWDSTLILAHDKASVVLEREEKQALDDIQRAWSCSHLWPHSR